MGGGITIVLCFIVFLPIVIAQGSSFDPRCSPENIVVVQMPTGKVLGCTQEWKVNVTNFCDCNANLVHLHCPKFDQVVLTNDDHYTITETEKSSGDCVLKNGSYLGVAGYQNTVFTYIGDKIDFALSAYSLACS